jgi:hypothetical protein
MARPYDTWFFFGGREMLGVKNTLLFNMWRFPEIGVPQNQLLKKKQLNWMILGVPAFRETSMYIYIYIKSFT